MSDICLPQNPRTRGGNFLYQNIDTIRSKKNNPIDCYHTSIRTMSPVHSVAAAATSSVFAYPTPGPAHTSTPETTSHSSSTSSASSSSKDQHSTIVGLSLTVTFLTLLLIGLAVAWCMKRRSARRGLKQIETSLDDIRHLRQHDALQGHSSRPQTPQKAYSNRERRYGREISGPIQRPQGMI